MFHASPAVKKAFAFLGGFLLVASIYTAALYYPLHQLCAFCITRVR
jgi:hypothetical protein